MKTILLIAWRNIWRNKRRSFITIGAILMAVFLTCFMRSLQIGSYNQMIEGSINQVGHLQIHKKGYWNKKTINNALIYNDKIKQSLDETPNLKATMKQLENFCLVSSGRYTKGALIRAAKPELLDKTIGLKGKIATGTFLEKNDNGILIARELAEFLHIINKQKEADKKTPKLLIDSLVIIGSGYQGISSYALLPIKGIVDLPSPQANRNSIFMTLVGAQNLFSPYVPNLCSSVAIKLTNPKQLKIAQDSLRITLGEKYEVMNWKEMFPEILQGIEADNAGGILMLGLLYIVVGFGMLSTIIMMTLERKKEFSIMLAVGMQKSRMMKGVIIETLLLGLTGVVIGVVLCFPIIYYLHLNPLPLSGALAETMISYNITPILPFSIDYNIFLNQALVVLGVSAICVLYPIYKISKLKPVDARNY